MANTAPTCTISLDKASYAPGATITATVSYADADTRTTPLTVTVTDAAGATGTATVSLIIKDTDVPTVSDGTSRVYTKVSDNGSIAVFTATA